MRGEEADWWLSARRVLRNSWSAKKLLKVPSQHTTYNRQQGNYSTPLEYYCSDIFPVAQPYFICDWKMPDILLNPTVQYHDRYWTTDDKFLLRQKKWILNSSSSYILKYAKIRRHITQCLSNNQVYVFDCIEFYSLVT